MLGQNKEGLHRGVVRVALPAKGQPRDRWLTRQEVASILWACWRHREVQSIHRGPAKGQREGHSFVDLEAQIFYRLAEGSRLSNKRQPPAPLPPRLLAHLNRWADKRLTSRFFVEWNGQPVRSVKTAFKTALRLAGVPGRVTPHTLRHTAATWLMQNGVDKWEAAGFLGMSVEMLDRVYGHHHPDHLRRAAHSLGYRRSQSLAITLAPGRRARSPDKEPVENIGGPGRCGTFSNNQMLTPK
jgi:integrase